MRLAHSLLLVFMMLIPTVGIARDDDTPSSPPSTPVPPPPAWLAGLDALYDDRLRVAGLDERRFTAEHWWDIATPLLASKRGFRVEEIGLSVEERPLRHVAWGKGRTRVLLWSQMHGDESTASMALADVFRFLGEHPDHPVVKRLRARTSLHILPILNPDGAARFQRRNVQGIDLNQDARALATPEARTLKALYDRVRPEYGFNLHDQRMGYRVGDSGRGVAIALLSPPYNAAGEVNPVRARAIEVAGAIRIALEPYLAGHMARWDETFNPRAFGDLTTQWGTSTVLIEAGGIEGDPQKQRLRKLYFLGLVAALDSIATGSHAGVPADLYRDLPENGDVWPDLLVRGGTLSVPGQPPTRADLTVNFKDPLTERGGSIAYVGDLADARARHTIHARGLYIVPMPGPTGPAGGSASSRPIVPGAPAYFHLSRDPHGHDIVWTLAGDVDAAHPRPAP
ncbi:M14 family zinc carboxypeptidase [Pseudoxanthomonas putridarboris]